MHLKNHVDFFRSFGISDFFLSLQLSERMFIYLFIFLQSMFRECSLNSHHPFRELGECMALYVANFFVKHKHFKIWGLCYDALCLYKHCIYTMYIIKQPKIVIKKCVVKKVQHKLRHL